MQHVIFSKLNLDFFFKIMWRISGNFLFLNPAEFLKLYYLTSIFGTVHYHFRNMYQDVNLKLVNQHFRAWSESIYVQTGLAIYWWQRLITIGSSRTIRVNKLNKRCRGRRWTKNKLVKTARWIFYISDIFSN